MDPFAANVGFLLLECNEEPKQRVMTMIQETPIKLPNCDRLDCDWKVFKDIYAVNILLHNSCCINLFFYVKVSLWVAKNDNFFVKSYF